MHSSTEDVCYDIKIKGQERRILSNVDGWVKPGTLTALMGASGAGKTYDNLRHLLLDQSLTCLPRSTLLDVLANRVTMGVISGSIFVDGEFRDRVRPVSIRKRCTGAHFPLFCSHSSAKRGIVSGKLYSSARSRFDVYLSIRHAAGSPPGDGHGSRVAQLLRTLPSAEVDTEVREARIRRGSDQDLGDGGLRGRDCRCPRRGPQREPTDPCCKWR